MAAAAALSCALLFGDAFALAVGRIGVAPGALPRRAPAGALPFVIGETVALQRPLQMRRMRLNEGTAGLGNLLGITVFPVRGGIDARLELRPGDVASVARPVRLTYDAQSAPGAAVSAVVCGDAPGVAPQRWL
eukprot:gene49493-13383_t